MTNKNWQGPRGWKGRAVADFGDFDFAALPWDMKEDETRSTGAARCVKKSRSRMALRIERRGRVLYAKRYLVNNLRRQIGNRIGGTKAEAEFELGHRLIRAGLATPEPLACAWHLTRSRGLAAASYLLTAEWPNEGSAPAWTKSHLEFREALWLSLARFLARAHERGFYHDDLSADHILVGPGFDPRVEARSRFAFMDIDNGALGDGPIGDRPRAVNLFQILRSTGRRVFPADMRRAFVEEYLRHVPSREETDFDRWARAIRRIARGKGVPEPI